LCDDWDVVCAEPWVRRKNSIKATAEAAVVAAAAAAVLLLLHAVQLPSARLGGGEKSGGPCPNVNCNRISLQ
jgi:hypothetical protein